MNDWRRGLPVNPVTGARTGGLPVAPFRTGVSPSLDSIFVATFAGLAGDAWVAVTTLQIVFNLRRKEQAIAIVDRDIPVVRHC